MPKPRRRLQTDADDLITAILKSRGRFLPFRPEWHATATAWRYFDDPPVGVERLEAAGIDFDLAEQLRLWRDLAFEHERSIRRRAGPGQ